MLVRARPRSRPLACGSDRRAGPVARALAVRASSSPLVGRAGLGLVARRQPYRPIQAYERGTIADASHRRRRRPPSPGCGTARSPGPARRAGRHGATPPTRRPPAARAWSWSPRSALAAARRQRPPVLGLPVQPAGRRRSGRQPGARGQHHGRVSRLRRRVRAGLGRRQQRDQHATRPTPSPAAPSCTTVAVAFQVVLIVGQANVAIPQNLSAAVNYSCIRCLTYALGPAARPHGAR